MSKKNLFLLAMLFSFGVAISQNSLIRKPAISNDGSKMAFSYYGDIWMYNLNSKQSKRLTIHKGYESNPVWNIDDTEIAFSSNRKGNDNVFITSLNGGVPKQLTYYPTANIPTDWTSEGTVVFTTGRVYRGPEWDKQMYTVNENGGTPERLLTAYGELASVSPNGKLIAFTKGACRIAREDYSGSAQRDIWIYNTDTKKYNQITTSNKNDHSPKWDAAGNLYYIGAKSGRYNVYKQAISSNGTANGNATQLTSEKKDGVREFSVSSNGAFIYLSGVNLFKVEDGLAQKITLNLSSDNRFEEEITKTVTNGISSYAVSPNGKSIALEINGEIFVKENNKEKKRSNNVSKHLFRDRNPQWINDKTVVFSSDRGGVYQLYSAVSTDTLVGLHRSLKTKVTKLTNHKEDVMGSLVSPDGKKIAYQVGRGILMIADLKDGKIIKAKEYSNSWAATEDVSWSPDSKYIAYSQEDLNFDSEIFIQSIADKSKKMNVSMHPRSDANPVWSADGKKLAFLSNRSGMNYDVWMVWLDKTDWEKSKIDHEEGSYYPAEKEKKEDKSDKKDKKKKKKIVVVKIDQDKIYDRLVQVTSLQDNEYSPMFSADSKFIYFSATDPASKKRSTYKVKWDGSKPKAIKSVSGARGISENKGKVYFTSRGSLNQLDTKSDKVTKLPHSATYTKNSKKEYEQVFEEGIRVLTAGFYDPEFHGYDWSSLVKRYRPWVLSATTHQDYTYMYNLLLGQLNASHMGYRGSAPKTVNDKVGLLGLDVVNTKDGVKVNYILQNTVADKSKSTLKVGDVITAVNGYEIAKNTNFYQLLKNTQGNEVLLSLKNGKDIVLRPQRSIRSQQYEAWITSRKKLVDEYSNGQLGYIHIQGMNMPSFERFERELKASGYGKKGIVIDVRYNGGGWTTDRLMAVLNVDQHAYTVPRGAAKSLKNNKKFNTNYPFNERAILSVNTKPVVALCNENSYSNAEIFSHAFKNLGLGKLVGQPTFGAVVSTGSARLQNGSIRMPFRAWFVKKSGKNMENEAPAVPDYLVKNAPGWKERGEDAQLQKAVEVLLQDLK
ncbi:PD40 domain-containing protein [Tenacibaculum sp. AHE15PA]|uniref:S41 family peptidase n=1 Tax=unclassified Tenacibaculum TaxID=2635139 RepID=UPI001C501943|nr:MULTISPECIES: S41 family peptidase [unclassified Tenacibaculum]QXP72588.1 PD40 domain-containing protein [Tenacibaculum sp. AHE14PA]QXP76502.1 PD40 domain-containing protein [Tenacibaculum sp. AHE15PA]